MRKFRFFFFLIIGLFIFKWVYNFFSGSEAIQLIIQNKFKLSFLIFAHIPTLIFDTYAWVVLMYKNKLSFLYSFVITWVAQTSSKFLPTGNITGEFIRFYLAKKTGQNTTEASSTVLLDLFIATFSLFIVGLLSSIYIILFYSNAFLDNNIIYFILSLTIILTGSIFFFLVIRKRLISKLIKQFSGINYFLNKKGIIQLLRLDYTLYKLSFRKNKLTKALVLRLLGWIAGAFEIYVFLWIINVDANLIDVILIESVTAIVRSLAFFIPGGLGVQEFAFVMIGQFLGYSNIISFSIAIGRRLREIMVGIPAIIVWYQVFKGKIKLF